MSDSENIFIRNPLLTLLSQPAFSEPEHVRVNRHGASSDAELLAEFAGRLPYQSHDNPTHRATRDFLTQFRNSPVAGALDHAHFSLLLENVSRSLSNELVQRQRGVGVSELSMRQIDDNNVAFVIPPALLGDDTLEAAWCDRMQSAAAEYRVLFDALLTRYSWIQDKTHRRRIARDGAFSVLPSSVATKLVITANARAWRSLIESHGHEHSDLESRRLAIAVRSVLLTIAPSFFEDFEVYSANDRHDAVRVRGA